MLKTIKNTRSNTSIIGSGSSKLGSSIAKQIQFAKMVNSINLSNHGLKTIYIIALRNRLVVVQPHNEVFAKFLV